MTDEELTQLLKDAQSRDDAMRESAELALSKLDDDEVTRAERLISKWSQLTSKLLIGYGINTLVCLIGLFCFVFDLHSPIARALEIAGLLAFGAQSIFFSRAIRNLPPDNRIAYIRARLGNDDAATAARLIDGMFRIATQGQAALAYERICQILPKLVTSDISPRHRRWLYSFLVIENFYNNAELMSAILEFIARAGDVEAYQKVKQLAQSPAVSVGAKRVRDKARECTQTLAPLVEQARLRDSLLRATDAPPGESSLLRPASGSATETELLLRAAPRGDHD